MKKIDDYLGDAVRIGISGHVHPDGDCIGACLGLKEYIRTVRPEAEVTVWLEDFSESFLLLKGAEEIRHGMTEDCPPCDLFFALDSAAKERLGGAAAQFDRAAHTVCLDHHITNAGFAQENDIDPQASSTSEMLYYRMDREKITQDAAVCLYLGIAFDTGVFRHTNCRVRTMEAAGELIEYGLNTEELLDRTYFRKTWVQNRVMGHVLAHSRMIGEGDILIGCISTEELREFGARSMDLEGIVDQLRVTEGVRIACFLHGMPDNPEEFKVSLRANGDADVAAIAARFGGGGHIKAAGCTIYGKQDEVVSRLTEALTGEAGD